MDSGFLARQLNRENDNSASAEARQVEDGPAREEGMRACYTTSPHLRTRGRSTPLQLRNTRQARRPATEGSSAQLSSPGVESQAPRPDMDDDTSKWHDFPCLRVPLASAASLVASEQGEGRETLQRGTWPNADSRSRAEERAALLDWHVRSFSTWRACMVARRRPCRAFRVRSRWPSPAMHACGVTRLLIRNGAGCVLVYVSVVTVT